MYGVLTPPLGRDVPMRADRGMGGLTVRDLVEAKLHEDEDAVIQDAVRCLLCSRADLCVRLAGVSWAQMRDILEDRGVAVRLGPDTVKEAREELDVLRTVPKS